ncbi:MAG: VWA domain-containing protein [Candidatus Thiodiazotropha sp. (ex Codakia rugifera)]|nr:VWA domain-containing protein [Candidatus Thiodiazotropha sp. (ex Codakia rugifera)]
MTGQTQQHATSLFKQVVHFSRALHDGGLSVNPANLIDLCKCFDYVDIQSRDDFYTAACTTLLSSREDLDLFDRVFTQFWDKSLQLSISVADDRPGEADNEEGKKETNTESINSDGDDPAEQGEDEADAHSYSADEILMKRDLGTLSDEEVEQASHLIQELVTAIATQWSRRKAPDKRGMTPDFRRMLRRNALHSAEGFTEMRYLSRRIKKNRLLLLCDVSGSMQHYSKFMIQFIYGLRNEIADLEVAVFSTRVTRISDLLRRKGIEASLSSVAEKVQDWSGGTDIGGCIGEFNDLYAVKLLRSRAVVIVLSDGWDRGDADVMREQMTRLKRRAYKLLWLNPLLGSQGYQPLCKGMATALPYLDFFLPAHSLGSLSQLAKTIQKIN